MIARRLACALMLFLPLAPSIAQESQPAAPEPRVPWTRFVETGDSITVVSPARGGLLLTGPETAIPAEADWRKRENGQFVGRFTVPETAIPRRYELQLATENEVRDLGLTLYVLDAAPERLRLWLTAPEPLDPEPGTLDVRLMLNAESPDQSGLPVIAASIDALRDVLPRSVRIGPYSVLVFDLTDHSNRALGKLHRMRRNLKDSQATIAVSLTRSDNIPFRAQSILFVDDPIQALILPGDTAAGDDLNHLQNWVPEIEDRPLIPVVEATAATHIDISPLGVIVK